MTELFRIFKNGGRFGLDRLPWINGGLFDDRPALPLDDHEVGLIKAASSQDWAHIDPTIFGTLFERFLDPEKRSQIGAHYTDAAKIARIVEPVVLRPLRQEWQMARSEIERLIEQAQARGNRSKFWERAQERRLRFLERLRNCSILDPACGSGNFLYLALQGVKDLEHAANQECEAMGLPPLMPMVGPEILRGIEINPLAAELARTTIWIGDIQWAVQNGIRSRPEPLLRRLDAIECRDALLAEGPEAAGAASSGVAGKVSAQWPAAEFIVGNPPFLGGKLLRRGLGNAVVEDLFSAFRNLVSPEADLVTYWFELARAQVSNGASSRAGFVATNSIRGGANRRIVERISKEMCLFEAWADEPWVVDGAAVRVSMVCFAKDSESAKLDGHVVSKINADLTGGSLDLTRAQRLRENAGVVFMGDTKGGAFEVSGLLARSWLQAPLNPNGRPNSDVLKPWANGLDLTRRPRDMWIVDFGTSRSEGEAAFYEKPFAHVLQHVRPVRSTNRRDSYARNWWQHVEPRPKLKARLAELSRYIVTPRVAKHRIFSWVLAPTVPDCRLFAFAREDDVFFGVLHSRFHEAWSLRTCSWHGVGNDPTYNSEGCFETYPFPAPIAPAASEQSSCMPECASLIASTAKQLCDLREAWLNPPDLVRTEPEVVAGFPTRSVPLNAAAALVLQSRTLTNLYNARPTWLDNAHNELDAAVAKAYGWPADISTEDALARLLLLNRERSALPC